MVGDKFQSTEALPPQPQIIQQPVTTKQGHTISDLMNSYFQEVEKSGNMTVKTQEGVKKSLELFIEVVGDLYIDELNHSHARSFKEILVQLPPNRNKMREFRGKPIEEVIRINKKKKSKTIGVNTINNNIGYVSSYFNWMRRNGYIQDNIATCS